MWLEIVLWWHEGSNSSQCSSTKGKGCWPTYIHQLWPCWWLADAMITYGILDISQYDTNFLAFKEVQPSNPQESKLVCLVLSLLLWNKAWRHCKAYNTNYEQWVFKLMDHPIFMVIICLWYNTQWPGWINSEEEASPTQCATKWYVSQFLWVNP
jgi:hypothetical protein